MQEEEAPEPDLLPDVGIFASSQPPPNPEAAPRRRVAISSLDKALKEQIVDAIVFQQSRFSRDRYDPSMYTCIFKVPANAAHLLAARHVF